MSKTSAAAAPAPAQASVDVATVRHRFNFDWAMSEPIEGIDTYWWWARSIRVDPSEVIADDGEGNLWSIPFTTDGADEITFSDPIRVRETFVPVAVADGAAATAMVQRRRQRVLAAALDRPEKAARTAASTSEPDDGSHTEETPMDLTTLRARLAGGDDVDDDEVIRLAAEGLPEPAAGDDPPETTETAPASVEQPEPAAASSLSQAAIRELREAGLTVVATEDYQELQSTVATLHTERETDRIAEAISAAVEAGRITPAERSKWQGRLEADFPVYAEVLAELPVKVPLRERGHSVDTPDDSEAAAFAASRARRFGKTRTQEA